MKLHNPVNRVPYIHHGECSPIFTMVNAPSNNFATRQVMSYDTSSGRCERSTSDPAAVLRVKAWWSLRVREVPLTTMIHHGKRCVFTITRVIWGPHGSEFCMHLSFTSTNIFLSPKVFNLN